MTSNPVGRRYIVLVDGVLRPMSGRASFVAWGHARAWQDMVTRAERRAGRQSVVTLEVVDL